MFEVGVNLLQDVDGVIDEQGQPGQTEEDPGSHEDAVPLWVHSVWVIICKGVKDSFSLFNMEYLLKGETLPATKSPKPTVLRVMKQ